MKTTDLKKIPRFSFGMGDRFGHQGTAQLKAIIDARAKSFQVTPVWNKSMREHTLIGTEPKSLRIEADAAVRELGYKGTYFVDADHINQRTIHEFIECSDFFTMDVADELGKPPKSSENATHFADALLKLGNVELPSTSHSINFDLESVHSLIQTYGGAVETVNELYNNLIEKKAPSSFAVEISMDETEIAQSPKELLGILCMLASVSIPVQTIAPKFTGRFNKGVDYRGDLEQFGIEFEADLLAIRYAIENLGLPESLKLSVHSGSDKFSLYPIIQKLVKKHNAGLHVKTAGTTWLEEVIGLAEAGSDGLAFVQQLYIESLYKIDELTAPYSTVLDIQLDRLPSKEEALNWTADTLVAMLAHDPENPNFNSSLRQLFHVAFKLAAQSGDTYYSLINKHADIIHRRVYGNLLDKHILKIFPANL